MSVTRKAPENILVAVDAVGFDASHTVQGERMSISKDAGRGWVSLLRLLLIFQVSLASLPSLRTSPLQQLAQHIPTSSWLHERSLPVTGKA